LEHTLNGSLSFTFDTITVVKQGVQSLLDLGFAGQNTAVEVDETNKELRLLSKTLPLRKDFDFLLAKSTELNTKNAFLLQARDLLQSLDFFFPCGRSLHLKLEKGRCTKTPVKEGGMMSWSFNIPIDGFDSILLSSISRLEIKLSGVLWNSEVFGGWTSTGIQ